jgi:hypothetical protein
MSKPTEKRGRKSVSARGKAAGKASLAHSVYVGLGQVVQRLPSNKLRPIKTAFEAGKPMKALALIAAGVKPLANDDSVIEQALMRGAKLKEELIEKAGGLLSSRTAANLLGISPQALHKRMHNGPLVAIGLAGGDLGYPAFQFESEAMQTGVAAVLEAIGVDEPWGRLNFLFLRLDELGGATAVDAIRAGKIAKAVLAASHYGEHGAS